MAKGESPRAELVDDGYIEFSHTDDPSPLKVTIVSFQDIRVVKLYHGNTEVEFYVTRTGRSKQIHVNGERVYPNTQTDD